MADIFGLIAPLFGIILLGYFVARVRPEPLEALGWLNIFIIYLALPALFIKIMAATPVEDLTNGRFIFGALAATAVILAVGFGLGLLFSRGRVDEAAIQGLASAYGNIGYMGPAIAILAFGEAAAAPVALIVCFENIMHFAFAPAMMAIAGRAETGDAKSAPRRRAGGAFLNGARLVGRVAAQIALHPFILAAAVGVALALAEARLPAAADRLIATLAQAAAPCALFAMGVTIALRPLRRAPAALGFIAPLKLIAHPLLMYAMLLWVGGAAEGDTGAFEPVWLYTAVLLAALPSATNVYVIASQYDVWVERASASVLATTALSVFTVSAALFWIQS